jgi:hypothetical protein
MISTATTTAATITTATTINIATANTNAIATTITTTITITTATAIPTSMRLCRLALCRCRRHLRRNGRQPAHEHVTARERIGRTRGRVRGKQTQCGAAHCAEVESVVGQQSYESIMRRKGT